VLNQQLNFALTTKEQVKSQLESGHQRLRDRLTSLEGQLQTAVKREGDASLAAQSAEAEQQNLRMATTELDNQLKTTQKREAELRTAAHHAQRRVGEHTQQMAGLSTAHANYRLEESEQRVNRHTKEFND
jgi:phage shock protein A